MWMTSCTGSVRGGFGGIWEKSVSWVLPREKTVDFRLLAEAWRQVSHVLGVGADGKISIERWYLSPYVKNPFNSKVIKSFVPELRNRVFPVSGFLCSMYICYEHSMYVSHIRISGYFPLCPVVESLRSKSKMRGTMWFPQVIILICNRADFFI